ncbi:MAG: UDP-N-acetylmuramoylalanine--D-glutamate ligase [Elusimicrobia bacterium RIFOXYA2_FULL_39_19]|nr:MAG: UDP-N-acetylmuramoylalanine--D-glutamate ligase [Elusimicrobia bacterium RIFOXYA2_FULL_39_19]
MLPYKKITVLGLGKTGVSIANYFAQKGAAVFVSDSGKTEVVKPNINKLNKSIKYETGSHTDKVLDCELIVRSPGIAHDLPVLIKARKKGIEVLSEIEVASRLIRPKVLIAITGTNGKTTTTTLVGEIFKNAGFKTVVAGNIGTPLIDFADKIDSKTAVVLEVSSYQLEDIEHFKPDISCILNITPDHLEHHKTMANYIKAKAKIFSNQDKNDCCILNYDDKYCRKLKNTCKASAVYFSLKKKTSNGIYCDRKTNTVYVNAFSKKISFPVTLKIPGRHNIENALAALACGLGAGLKPGNIIKTLESFEGVEHRIEFVRDLNGVRYINDSKSTNVDSTYVALESFEKNIILIMGGRHKGAPYTPLKKLVKTKVKKLLLIGEAIKAIKKDLSGTADIIVSGDMGSALKYSKANAVKGDVVLLSPGCASFDQFKNYEHRGEVFKQLVNKLK